MTIYKLLFFILILTIKSYNCFSQTEAITPKTISFEDLTWSEVNKKAIENNKLIFFDAYTSWCGPCKLLEKKVFIEPEIYNFFNENFINYKLDMEEGEGITLAEEFEILAYPTLLFYDPKTQKVKISKMGYQKKEELLNWAKSAL